MNKTIYKEPVALISIILYLFFTLWWALHFFQILPDEVTHIDLFSDLYFVLALIGGAWGLYVSKLWGGTKSVMGRVVIAFSLGLLCQVFGQVMYSYYFYVLHIENPYPSLGDFGFYATIPVYIYAVLQLSHAVGATLNFKTILKSPVAILLPLGMLVLSYEIFLREYVFDWSDPLIIFLDFVNPLGQAIYISLGILTFILSFKMLGGVMRKPILVLLLGLVFQYLADFTFLY